MRMSDIVSAMDMTLFPQAGLVIFFGVFVVVSARAVLRKDPEGERHAASLPLDDETAADATEVTHA